MAIKEEPGIDSTFIDSTFISWGNTADMPMYVARKASDLCRAHADSWAQRAHGNQSALEKLWQRVAEAEEKLHA